MARPKGSKNKVKNVDTVASIEAKIAAALDEQKKASDEEAAVLEAITEARKKLSALRKTGKKLGKDIAKLEAAKAEAVAVMEAEKQKADIAAIVTKLVSSGKSAEDIMAVLGQE